MIARYFTVPNFLSLVRVPLAALFVLLPDAATRVVIVAAAGASDYLDGWWARTRGPRTRAGALLDPITDKIFVLVVLLAFTGEGVLTAAQLLVLLARDLFVSMGVLVLVALRRTTAVRLQARFPGKFVTTMQLLAVLLLTVVPQAATALVIVTAAASAWAIADYSAAGLRALRAAPQPR